jgi:hypothetical protein
MKESLAKSEVSDFDRRSCDKLNFCRKPMFPQLLNQKRRKLVPSRCIILYQITFPQNTESIYYFIALTRTAFRVSAPQ